MAAVPRAESMAADIDYSSELPRHMPVCSILQHCHIPMKSLIAVFTWALRPLIEYACMHQRPYTLMSGYADQRPLVPC